MVKNLKGTHLFSAVFFLPFNPIYLVTLLVVIQYYQFIKYPFKDVIFIDKQVSIYYSPLYYFMNGNTLYILFCSGFFF